MLLELRIKDFAIIDNLSISFSPGLNIFTGETGAGKSIIIDAVRLILGDRASADLVRTSKDEAVVEALFHISAYKGVMEALEGSGFSFSENLIVKRIISRSGRSKIFINNSLATLMTLAEIGGRLIDIYGQNDHQSLARPEEHIELLDAFAELTGLRREMVAVYKELSNVQSALEGLVNTEKSNGERRDLLQYQSGEIEDAALNADEERDLLQEKAKLTNAARLFKVTTEADNILYSGEGAVLERIGHVVNKLSEVSDYDERLNPHIETLRTTVYQIEEAASFLRDYSGGIDSDQARLEEVESRLDLIARLKGKYGQTIEGILQRKKEIDEELARMNSLEDRVKELGKEADAAREAALSLALELSKRRKKASLDLKKAIEEELATLGMEGTVFDVKIHSESLPDGSPRIGEKGMDRVAFYLSPNPGEELKSLARIASGGELSRIMLAVKRVANVGKVPTIVFDEVDTGISGGIADIVGRKLKKVSMGYQVICITHLPQIAAYADLHFSVSKETEGGRTSTVVKRVEGDGIVEELSRILAGDRVTPKTREHAKELLGKARENEQADRISERWA